ncbi:MAG: hypothetical protein A2W55_00070 [Candidatus Nealsonbacteria bacterium RIFCSPHIGHO2_02_38_10]|nr:MAG: hypothetical protein A2W55_00070 [Candidatus Nealsonbacteria bacterium RIFCSPHIGHO2_02_38_10]
MSNKATNILAAGLLIFTFLIALFSMVGDSLTMDELAHLPAGYSYLTQKDMRLNPEHPPLIKDLSAIPLLFINGINFPSEIKSWNQDINGQWDFGNSFLFQSNNPADQMIFWARIPMIFILILLGYYIFRWSRELFGNKAAILSLFLFCFSPTLLAHSRLVTTDVGAAAGAFIATYYFVKFLKNNSWKNLIIAGIVLGIAEMLKFSLILLFPAFGILLLIWTAVRSSYFKKFIIDFFRALQGFILIIAVCFVLIWVVYQYHTWNLPPEKQANDTQTILSSFGSGTIVNAVVWMADKPILRPFAQYFLGVCMVLQRTSGGNTTFFLGEISSTAWKNYFPVIYAIKEPLSFHILLIIAILYFIWTNGGPFWQGFWLRIKNWLLSHFPEFAMLLFIAIYWLTSISGNLNIGIRHLLPIFPFTILLVAGATSQWLKPPLFRLKRIFLSILLIWQAIGIIAAYPHFISYYNELAGGPANGYIYAVDSNYDWGQDLKRLVAWTEKNNIDKIYVDYFGGADAKYYLKDKFLSWWGNKNQYEIPLNSYLAVSATFLQGGKGEPAPGFNGTTGYYRWLGKCEPIRISYSIFVYHITGFDSDGFAQCSAQ